MTTGEILIAPQRDFNGIEIFSKGCMGIILFYPAMENKEEQTDYDNEHEHEKEGTQPRNRIITIRS